MKKYLIVFAVIIAFAFYAFWASSRHSSSTVADTTTPSTSDTGVVPIENNLKSGSSGDDDDNMPATGSSSSGISPTQPSPAVPSTPGPYKDGSYTSPVVDAYFGPVQIKTTISGGKITDIVALKYPNDQGESRQISNRSLPILKSEALKAQSAKLDNVSGATQTADGYKQALAATLAMAK